MTFRHTRANVAAPRRQTQQRNSRYTDSCLQQLAYASGEYICTHSFSTRTFSNKRTAFLAEDMFMSAAVVVPYFTVFSTSELFLNYNEMHVFCVGKQRDVHSSTHTTIHRARTLSSHTCAYPCAPCVLRQPTLHLPFIYIYI